MFAEELEYVMCAAFNRIGVARAHDLIELISHIQRLHFGDPWKYAFDGNGMVLRSVEDNYRHLDGGRQLLVRIMPLRDCRRRGSDGCPSVMIFKTEIQRTRASHRLAHDVDAPVIDIEFRAHQLQDIHYV